MACLKSNIHSGAYSCLTEKDLDKHKSSGHSTIQHFNYFWFMSCIHYENCNLYSCHFFWFPGHIASTSPLSKLPILRYPFFTFSFYAMSIPINVFAPKIGHNLNCSISINHQYLCEDIIIFFIFYSIQFTTDLHLSFIRMSVLFMTHLI